MAYEKPIFFLTEEDVYSGSAPAFYEDKKFNWVSILEENYHILLEEFSEYIQGHKPLEKSSVNPPYLSDTNAWQNVYFWNFLWQKHPNCKRFPKTYQLLKSVPNLIFAEVTCLKGNSKILPHIGETNVTMRGHLGLKIPNTDSAVMGIEVSGQTKGWEEGKVILFSDAHRHHVWNNSNEDRYVLVFDVLRDEYANKKYWMCAQALSSLTIKYVDENIPIFKKLPKFLLMLCHYIISSFWFLYLPLQNKLSFLP